MGKTVRSAAYDEDDDWADEVPAHVSHIAAKAVDDPLRWRGRQILLDDAPDEDKEADQ